jgi:hypothetical protein
MMSVFEPVERSIFGGEAERVFKETSKKEVQASNIIEAIQMHETPEDIIEVTRGFKVQGTPLHTYVLKLEKIVGG